MTVQVARAFLTAHWRSAIWVIWVLWGLVALGLANTEMVNWPWFSTFRFWMGQVVPTVRHPPSRDLMEPVVASSFLAIIWVTSPILWLGFRQMPAEKFFTRVDWTSPFSGRILLGVVMMAIIAIMALDSDWSSRHRMNVLVTKHPISFSAMASIVSALPWYTLALLKAWLTKVNEYSNRKGD